MSREKLTLRQSFEHVRRTRDMIRPNDSFMQELLRMEHDLHGATSMTLADLPAMKLAFTGGGGNTVAVVDVDAWARERLSAAVLASLLERARGNRKAFTQLCVAHLKAVAVREAGVAKKRAAAAATVVAHSYYDAHNG